MDGICSTCTKDVIIPFVSAILGIAIPLLIGVIQRIDDKYSSTRMIKQFAKEKVVLFFITFLILTIIFLFLVPNMPLPSNRYEGWDYIKHGFPLLFSYGFCILSIISFFHLTYYVYLYNNPHLIQKHLINNLKDEETRKTWWEFYNYLHTTDNADALRLGYQTFKELCEGCQKKSFFYEVTFPADLYNGVLTINETLCSQQKKVVSIIDGKEILRPFFDDRYYSYISKSTFYTISICLSQQLYYKRSDWFLSYWGMAHHYFMSFLDSSYEGLWVEGAYKKITSDMVNKMLYERDRFVEFHITLGAMLLHQKEYALIKQVLYFTNTQPPRYLLIPNSLSEIIILFMKLISFPLGDFHHYREICFFSELRGNIKDESIIEGWVQTYLSLLIIRLYTLQSEYSYKPYLDIPRLPSQISEKKIWLQGFPILENKIQEIVKAQWLDEVLEEYVNTTKENVSKDILAKLKTIKIDIENSIKYQRRSQDIYSEEVDLFNKNLIVYVQHNIKPYIDLSLAFPLERSGMENEVGYDVAGLIKDIRPLDLFVKDKEVVNVNFRDVLANNFVDRFKSYYQNSFAIPSKIVYRIFSDDIFKAITLLNLNKDNHVLLGFGVDGRNLFGDISSSSENKYLLSDGLEFYSLPSTRSSHFSNCIVVIRKDDIPEVIIEEPGEDLIKKFHLKLIDDNSKIYTSIVKLNEEDDLRNEILQSSHENEDILLESVLVYAIMKAKIKWKSDCNIALIKILYQFQDSGDDNLNKITPF